MSNIHSLLIESGYAYDEEASIWTRQDYKDIKYNDGDEVEKRIGSILENAKDLSVLSDELRPYCVDWPSTYHLSVMRANILRPFEAELTGDILEIGAGCGAITRYLGECGGNVLALEGTLRRASIARARTRDLENVTVVSDVFEQFNCEKKFDVVTLIGVLEYANLFTAGNNPALSMLEHVSSFLKPNGRLFIAIENKFGLKYFAGAPEDHIGTPMYGLESRYGKKQPKTFGRNELDCLIRAAGFSHVEFLAPFPDYKLPASIVTEHGFASNDFDAAAFAWQSVRRDPQLPKIMGFSPELAWPSVVSNGIAMDLANSFLVVATPQKKSERVVYSNALAWHFTTARRKTLCKETQFIRNKNNQIDVLYKRLDINTPNLVASPLLTNNLSEQAEYIHGEVLLYDLIRIVTADGWSVDQLSGILKSWLNCLSQLARSTDEVVDVTSPFSQVSGELFDCIPQNIIHEKNGSFNLIDDEWILNGKIEIGYLVFRSALALISTVTKFGRPADDNIKTLYDFIVCNMTSLGWSISDKDIEKWVKFESEIQTEVSSGFVDPLVVMSWLHKSSLPHVNLSQAVSERDGQIANLNQAVSKRDAYIQNLNNTIDEIRSSTSWRVSAPVRWVGGGVRRIKKLFRLPFVALKRGGGLKKTLVKGRNIYKTEGLLGLKRLLLGTYEFESISPGQGFHAPQSYGGGDRVKDEYIKQVLETAANKSRVNLDFVPRAETNFDLSNCPIKAIAFYLPQFHPIPENDEWWGKGFTEWTNVSKAVPQFVGHYQPHLPGELGFYDLRLVDVQRQQIELAKQYGIHGFCYHHYWFGGKRLLEKPFNQILANPDLDFPFCLCWANENWTRRWDGQEQDVLMAQNHSPEDDLAFIADIAPALRDSRYIRFNGRPILIVYRVALLPDARATAQRWRDYCRDEGIGELYLVAARSFNIKDPRAYGFDASLEFPPHEANSRILNGDIEFLNPDFEGNVYSYVDMVDSHLAIDSNDYPIIKTVCPGWDNEARKPGKGHIFLGSSPDAYARWLRGACNRTLEKIASNSKHPPFVFVNAWNEWAEGAHLEPDRKYGYANLHVTANSLQAITPCSSDIQVEITDSQSRFRRASDGAVIIHLFYGDLLDEILPYLDNTKNMDLFVSLGPNVTIDEIRRLRKAFPNCYIEAYPNKGRDLLPFINLLKVLKSYGYTYGCKLHTKKSLQRNDGIQLRREAFESLVGTQRRVQEFMRMFEGDDELGLAAPSKWFLDLSEPNRNVLNRSWLDRLLPKLEREDLIGTYSWQFFAGTMFWFRVESLEWLLSLNISSCDFEEELGQIDGTLAHSLERLINLGITQSGYKVLGQDN